MNFNDSLRSIRSRVNASPLATRFLKGALWSVFGSSVSRGLALIASIITARIVGQAEFGQLGIIQSTVGTLGTFAGLGLGMTATKYVSSLRISDPDKTGKILALLSLLSYITAALVSIGLIIYAPAFAKHTLKEQQLTLPLQIGAVLMFLSVVNGVQTGALAGLESFRSISQVSLISGVCSFPLIIVGGMSYGLCGTMAGLTVTTGINCWLNNRILRTVCKEHDISYNFTDCFKEFRIIIKFTIPSALSSFIVAPALWYTNLMLINQPNGYLEMGLFNAANQWQTAILFLPTALSPLILSLLANKNCGQDKKEYWRIVKLSFIVNIGIVSIAAASISICSPYIMKAYGFTTGWEVLCLLSIVAILNASLNVIGQIIASSASMWWGFLLNLFWAIAFITFASLFVKPYGALGLALSFVTAYSCHIIWTGIYTYKKVKIA
jgi:O-antigen/teichoic acid export membrane protein